MEKEIVQLELLTFGITLMKKMLKGIMCGQIIQKSAK